MDDSCKSSSQLNELVYHSSFLTVFSSCLTIFGSCLIILTFILWKDIRRSVARVILLFLALADLGTGLGYLVSSTGYILYQKDKDLFYEKSNSTYFNFCTGTSFITTFFPVSSFFWTTCLAIYFFVALVLVKPRWSRKLLIIFNLIAWVVPLIICSVAVSFGVLGESNYRMTAGWCFVALSGTNNNYNYSTYLLLEVAIYKIWEFLLIAIVMICYTAIFCVNRKCYRWISSSAGKLPSSVVSNHILYRAISKIDWKLLFVPILLIILQAPGNYRYFLSMSPSCNPNYNNRSCSKLISKDCFELGGNYYILFLQAFFDPLQGFVNAILFVFLSRAILQRLAQTFGCYNCLRRFVKCLQEEYDDESLRTTSNMHETTTSRKEYDSRIGLTNDRAVNEDNSSPPSMHYGSVSIN